MRSPVPSPVRLPRLWPLTAILLGWAPTAHATLDIACLLGPPSVPETQANPLEYPQTPAEIDAVMTYLQRTVYAKQVALMLPHRAALTPIQIEALWRMSVKARWREPDATDSNDPESRFKILSNRERTALEESPEALDESPDPADAFEIHAHETRPGGMPNGSYNLASGKSGFLYNTTADMLANREPERFELEFQQVTHDGKIVVQQGSYAAADSNWGWDGRLEKQPDGKGGWEIIVTQGSQELPDNFSDAEANPGQPKRPAVSLHNETRSRHLYKVVEWVPAKDGKPAKLVLRGEGSILNMKPSSSKEWIEHAPDGTLLHAHGYGENFIADPRDHRKMWKDKFGYTWRIFDQVTKQTTIRNEDGSVRHVPTETRAVGYRMDLKNPSKIVKPGTLLPNGNPADHPVFFTSNFIPGTDQPIPATVRYAFNTHGPAVSQKELGPDGKVRVQTEGVPQNQPALLNEGFNLFHRAIQLGKRRFFVGTNSAGEYTSGGPDGSLYGVYLWLRDAKRGKVGPYKPTLVLGKNDFMDMARQATQMYGLSWGLGRPQLIEHEGKMFLKLHAVDTDLLRSDLPKAGYPERSEDFANAYRRQQILIPVKLVQLPDGRAVLRIDTEQFHADVAAWTKRKNSGSDP